MTVEEVGELAPVAGSLTVLACDAAAAASLPGGDDGESLLHAHIKAVIGAWQERRAQGDCRDASIAALAGVPLALFSLQGWNMMAGVYRIPAGVVIVDPHLDFWEQGGSQPDESRGDEFADAFRQALRQPLPEPYETLGQLEIPSGRLLLADSWQALEEEGRVVLAVDPGVYALARQRLVCPWDPVVNDKMGIQAASLRLAG